MSPLNPIQLQCLDAVARTGSFSSAAAALNLSQPSVSMHVGNLERVLGVQLLLRSARGASLTEAGEELLPHLRSVLRAEEIARQRALSLRGKLEGRVRIGGVGATVSQLVPEAIGLTLDRHSQLSFEVSQMSTDKVRENVLSGAIDVGLLVDYANAAFDDLDAELLTKGPTMLVVRRGHHLLNQEAVVASEVAAEPLVLMANDHLMRQQIMEYLNGYDVNIVGEVDSHETIRRLVSVGVGVTLLPWMKMSSNPGVPSNLRGRPLADMDAQPGLWMLYSTRQVSRAAEEVIDSIREVVTGTR